MLFRSEVEDATARGAREVAVATHARVESDARSLVNLGEESVLGKQTQIAVHGAEAHVRQLAADLGVNPLGRRMTLGARSEEHTSELQSLMRSSYAVFCLK